METIEDYRMTLRRIADFAFSFGIDSIPEDKKTDPLSWTEQDYSIFRQKCHEGFKEAQNLIVKNLMLYQKEYQELKDQLKNFRRCRDKDSEQETQLNINIVEQRMKTFSHIADGIAWQLIGNQIHVARRLHIGESETKFLENANFQHTKKVVDKLNENPDDFALISDLTSFVQIGDVLHLSKQGIKIIELKEGAVNDKISEFLEEVKKKGQKIEEVDLSTKFDKTTAKQVKRVVRQRTRGERATHILNTDKGIDPVSEKPMSVSTPTIETEYYHPILAKLYEQLESRIWSYDVVEDCVHIGMYKGKGLQMAPFIIPELLNKETENNIYIDWMTITHNVSEPIFSKPFPPDFIIDILTGYVKVIIGVNFDKLVDLFNQQDLKTRWISEKETMRMKQKEIRKNSIAIINKKAIEMSASETKKIILGGGLVSKIIYDSIYPSNIAQTLLNLEE
ncbi:MAG: hypothetical protein ABJN36_07620 [Cyclobacteriaceae bacterium]